MSDDPGLHFSVPAGSPARLGRGDAGPIFAVLATQPYTSASLGGVAISDGAATVAAQHLRSLARRNSLHTLSLADTLASLPEKEALRTLSTLAAAASDLAPSLRTLDLSHNALGPKGLAALASLLNKAGPTLTHLYLSHAGLSADAVKLLPAFLAARRVTALHTLHIAHSVLTNGLLPVATLLEKSPGIADVRLASLRGDADGIGKVLRALKGTRLISLDLSDNSISIDAALGFDTLLKTNPGLERLVLSDMAMGDDAAYLVLKAVAKSGAQITQLDLSGNSIGVKSAAAIGSTVLARRDELVELHLDENPIGADAALGVVRVLSEAEQSSLRILSLDNVGLDDVTAVRIALVVRGMLLVEKLAFGGVGLRRRTVNAIRDALPEKEIVCGDDDQLEEDDGEVVDFLEELLDRLAQSPATNPTAASSSEYEEKYEVEVGGSRVFTNSILSKFFAGSSVGSSAPPLTPVDEAGFRTPLRAVRSSGIGGGGAAGSELSTPAFSGKNSAMVLSARQLRSQVDSLEQEVSELVQELDRGGSFTGMPDSTVSALSTEVQVLGDQTRESLGLQSKSLGDELFDVFWACLLALFIVIVVVSIAHNQDERTFGMRPV